MTGMTKIKCENNGWVELEQIRFSRYKTSQNMKSGVKKLKGGI